MEQEAAQVTKYSFGRLPLRRRLGYHSGLGAEHLPKRIESTKTKDLALMSEIKTATAPRPIAEIASYHAHIYYDPLTTRSIAERLRVWISERFPVQLGRWHDARVVPTMLRCFRSRLPMKSSRRWYPG